MLYHPNFIILLILILGGREAWRRYRGRNTAESRAFSRSPVSSGRS